MQTVETDVIAEKLDILIQLVSLALIEDKKHQKDQIWLLSRAGLRPIRIAQILGTTSNTVKVAVAKMRKVKPLNSRR